MGNFYQVLGLSPRADREKIKAAFWGLAKRSHPDVNGDERAEQRFKEINRAYETLSDLNARAAYDLDLRRERACARRRFWQATTTMLATFILTVGLVSTAILWLESATPPRSEISEPNQLPRNDSVAANSQAASQQIDEKTVLGRAPTAVQLPGPLGEAEADAPQPRSSVAGTSSPEQGVQMPTEQTPLEPPTAPATGPQSKTASGGVFEPGEEPGMLGEPASQAAALVVAPPPNRIDLASARRAEPNAERQTAPEQPASRSQLVANPAKWTTYRNTRFGFALRYPDDVFAPDSAAGDNAVRVFVSRDGRAVLRISAAPNAAATTLTKYRRSLMEQRYGGATFDYTPERSHWFVLSGTLGEEMFYERTTFSCDRRSMHGWLLLYPLAERAFYDRIIEEIHRSYRHGNGPGARCGEAKRFPFALPT